MKLPWEKNEKKKNLWTQDLMIRSPAQFILRKLGIKGINLHLICYHAITYCPDASHSI